MNLLDDVLNNYIEQHSTPLSDVLQNLYRDTHLRTLSPMMVSGHQQGILIQFLSKMIQPEKVLEIGTFTGFSTICWAEGLSKNGTIDTLELNDEYKWFHQKYFNESGFAEKIKVHYGNAREIIPQLNSDYNVVFIDADKPAYSAYFDLVIDKVKSGGWIIADNVLWKGKVLEQNKDKTTEIIDAFNKKVSNDNRVESLILSIRDGLNIMRKK
jgi:predicted O-methyltransferase YrrM